MKVKKNYKNKKFIDQVKSNNVLEKNRLGTP